MQCCLKRILIELNLWINCIILYDPSFIAATFHQYKKFKSIDATSTDESKKKLTHYRLKCETWELHWYTEISWRICSDNIFCVVLLLSRLSVYQENNGTVSALQIRKKILSNLSSIPSIFKILFHSSIIIIFIQFYLAVPIEFMNRKAQKERDSAKFFL